MDHRLAVLIFMIFRVYCSYLFLFYPDFFLVFHNTVIIHNTRNRSNDTTESQKEKKTCFNAHFQYCQLRIMELNRMWSLKSLAMFKCESSYVLVYMQYDIRDSQALFWCFVLVILRMASLDTLFFCSVGQQAWLCS